MSSEMVEASIARFILSFDSVGPRKCEDMGSEGSVWIQSDAHVQHFVGGKNLETGMNGAADLAQFFLEYAESVFQPGRLAEAYLEVGAFAERLSEALVAYETTYFKDYNPTQHVVRLVASVLTSLSAQFTFKKSVSQIEINMYRCPICETAKRTGTRRVLDLAHHGVMVLLQEVVKRIDPGLRIRMPEGPYAFHSFTISRNGTIKQNA